MYLKPIAIVNTLPKGTFDLSSLQSDPWPTGERTLSDRILRRKWHRPLPHTAWRSSTLISTRQQRHLLYPQTQGASRFHCSRWGALESHPRTPVYTGWLARYDSRWTKGKDCELVSDKSRNHLLNRSSCLSVYRKLWFKWEQGPRNSPVWTQVWDLQLCTWL